MHQRADALGASEVEDCLVKAGAKDDGMTAPTLKDRNGY
jgi:hypothetical protein